MKTGSPQRLLWLECDHSELPPADDWLTRAEVACVRERWVPKRRQEWLLGRWTAKIGVSHYLFGSSDRATLSTISILPTESGAPAAFIGGCPAHITLSLSHCHGRAFVVLSPENMNVGCDLEKVEDRSPQFRRDFFTLDEFDQIERSGTDANLLETILWSAKESVLKEMHVGLRVDTRCVSVHITLPVREGSDWQSFRATVVDGRHYHGWCQCADDFVRTVATAHATAAPIAMQPTRPLQCTASLVE